jgi:anti-anti-sigma regulatory factor
MLVPDETTMRLSGVKAVFMVSGRIRSGNLTELQKLIKADAAGQRIVLDLKEVVLVDRDAVRFLKRCESNGIELRNCSAYIREWINREPDEDTI